MGSRHDVTLRGFLTSDPRLPFSALDSTNTSYTEASPTPGSPVGADARSRLSLRISGAQEEQVDTQVVGAGHPGRDPDAACRVVYKLDGEAATEWRGWSPPGMLHQCDCLSTWSSINVFEHHDLVTIPSSQKVVAVYAINSAASTRKVRTLDPTTWTWAAEVTFGDAVNRWDDVALCVLPDERVLAICCGDDGSAVDFWRVYYSDDSGATWSIYSQTPFPSVSGYLASSAIGVYTLNRSRMLADRRGNVLFIREGSAVGPVPFMVQYASNSLGTSFSAVGSAWTVNPPTQVGLVLLPSGKIGVASYDGAATRARILGSPWDSIEGTTPVQISGSTGNSLATWVDDDGVWWVMKAQTSVIYGYYSTDEGGTWTQLGLSYPNDALPFYSGDGATKYYPDCASASMGRAILAGNSVDGGGGGTVYDGMVWAVALGEWSNVEAVGWLDGSSFTGLTWLPIELPGTIGNWTRIATGGGETDILTTPGMNEIITNAESLYYRDTVTIGANLCDYVALVDIDVIVGGSASSNQVALNLYSGDGGTSRLCSLCFSATQYAIEDSTTGRGTVTHGIAGRLQVLVHYDETNRTASSWYREHNGENWTRGHTDVVINNNAGANPSQMYWGHISASTSQSNWYQCHIAWRTTLGQIEPPHELATLVGKAMSPARYPLPEVGSSTYAAFMAAVSGPGRRDETWDIDPIHSYSADRMFPEVNPSPTEPWRSADDGANQDFGWDLDQVTGLGSSTIALACIRTNVDGVYVRQWSGGAFANIAAFSPGQSCTFARVGDSIWQSGATPLAQYLWRGMLDGAWVDLGGGKYRIIRHQTEGMFDSSLTTKQARLWLEGIDGTEPANGSCVIYPHSWVYVMHAPTESDRYQVRFQSSSLPEGYHRVGSMVLGPVTIAGRQWSRGWSWEAAPNATEEPTKRGSVRVREMGPVRRQFSVNWQDGYGHGGIRKGDPDYLQATAGGERATRDDVGWWLASQLTEWQSGQRPVVALAEIPQTSGLIWDPTKFLYGYVASTVGMDNVEGDVESTTRPERLRTPSFTIKEHI